MKRSQKQNLIKKLRKQRVRAKFSGTAARPRASVFRSNKFLYVQLIDDQKGKTVISSLSKKGLKSAQALGQKVAELAKKANIKELILDRGAYKYHGQVKAVADAMKAAGLKL